MTIAPNPRISERVSIRANRHAASSGHYLATAAAMRIFQRGGNAIDAGVAAGLVIDVVLPDLCNFGGVAPIIVYHHKTDQLVSISGLGNWGRRANREHFVNNEGGEIPIGAQRSIVPGAPDSWLTALAQFGRLSFAEVVQPAKELAEGGFVVYPSLHRNLSKAAAKLAEWPSSSNIYLQDGQALPVGAILRQPDLARTFERLAAAERAAEGRGRGAGIEAARNEFYRGEVAREIAEFIQQQGGFVDEQDLADFAVEVEQPPQVSFHGIDVAVCGPWCQGPALAQSLMILDKIDLKDLGHNTDAYVHTVAEAMNLAFADRERFYGDPNFVDVPLDQLLSADYADQRRALIDAERAFGALPPAGDGWKIGHPSQPTSGGVPADADTSYVCAVDEEGNAFSATPSDGVGSTPIVPGLGLICSGRGSQSWLGADHSSSLEPGKRPRLTPNPAMAFKDGELFMPFGTPGGDMQIQSMLQTFLNIVVFDMDVQQAVEAPRFGSFSFPNSFWPHEYQPGRLCLEGRISEETGSKLVARGHDVEWWPDWTRIAGNVCAIVVDPERRTLTAGADLRAEAVAAGW